MTKTSIWMAGMAEELGDVLERGVEIEEDNKGVQTAAKGISGKIRAVRHRMKDVSFLVSAAQKQLVSFVHIPGSRQVADAMTKVYGPLDHFRRLGWVMGESEELERLMRIVISRFGKTGVAAACMGQEGAGEMEEDGESTEKQGAEVMGNTEENANADTKRLCAALGELRMRMDERREAAVKRVLQLRQAAKDGQRELPKEGKERRGIKRAVEVSVEEWNRMYPEQLEEHGEIGPETRGAAGGHKTAGKGRARATDYFKAQGSDDDDEDEVRSTASEGTGRRQERGCSGARGGDTERGHSADEAQEGWRRAHVSIGKRGARDMSKERREAQRKGK
jgi:hypothetical protein